MSKDEKNRLKRPKTGGRQKGTPNKKSLAIHEALGDFDPLTELKEIMKRTQDDELKAHICLNLLKYMYPQRKAITTDAEAVELPRVSIDGI